MTAVLQQKLLAIRYDLVAVCPYCLKDFYRAHGEHADPAEIVRKSFPEHLKVCEEYKVIRSREGPAE